MSRSPGKAPPTDGTPPNQMIPNDPIGETPPPPPNPNRPPNDPGRVPNDPGRVPNDPGRVPNDPGRVPNDPGRVPNDPDRIPNEPERAVPDNRRPYESDYRTPPNERIDDIELPYVPVVVPNAPNIGIYDNVEALLAANLNEQQHVQLYMRENQRELQVFAQLMANYQRNNEQDDEQNVEQANVQENIPQADPAGRKILGRAGGGIKVNSSTQTLPDTRGVDNAWLHDSRRRADALCEEIFNLINRLYHGSSMKQRHSIPQAPQKKSVISGNRRRSVGEVPPYCRHETEEDRRAAAERRFYFEIRRDMSGISNSAIYLRNSIPLPRTDEEQRFPSPESPPVLLPVEGLAEALGIPPIEQQQEEMAASGFQTDMTSGLANMTLEESMDVWRDQENSSEDCKGKKTTRRKALRNSLTEGHVPQQRSPLLYKSPHKSSSKPHTKRVKSAQKASGKDNEQHPCTSATGRSESVNTGMLGARPKISSTSVWGRGYIASSTPHVGKKSGVSAVNRTSTTPIAQSTSLASGVSAASIGTSSQDSKVPSRAISSALGIASLQSSASDIVKEAASKATSAMLIELHGTRDGVHKKTYSSQMSSATGSSSQTSSGEPSKYQRTGTKSIERPRPDSHASYSMGKRKAPKAPTFTSRETRGIPGVLKGTNVECVLMGKSHSSLTPKISSASGKKDTRGPTRMPKEASSSQASSKSGTTTQSSSKSGTNSSSQMSSSESGKSRRSNERPHSRQVSDAVGKKRATQAPKFTSTAGRENLGVSGVLKGTNIECVLKGRSQTPPASKIANTPRAEASGATSGGDSSNGVVAGVTSTVTMGVATTSLPKGDTVPKGSPKVATASRVPKLRLSDQASNAGARTGGERTTVFNPDDMSLGLLRPRLPYLVTDPTPVLLSRRASDLAEKKPTSQTLKKKPHSY